MGVYCTASADGSLDYTSNDPQITFTIGGGCGETSGGGGAAGRRIVPRLPQQKLQEEVTISVIREVIRGDGICDEALGEDLWNSPTDCVKKAFEFDEVFCMPLFQCGNWKKGWFINLTILMVTGFLVYFMVFKKKGRL